MGKDLNSAKLMGGKRKNGHKYNCTCHICENMKNKARRGGYQEDIEKEQEKRMGGSKKKNGHRTHCKCPICKNMNHSKKRGGSKSNRKTRKMRGGNDNDTESDEETDEETESESDEDTESESDEETEKMNKEEEDKDKEDEDKEEDKDKEDELTGGKRKRSNGHKSNCKCPICKNMRKSKKGGDEPDIENQKGDIEEAGVKSFTNNESYTETKASDDEYDQLDAAEKGEAGQNVVGGTRKRRYKRRHKKTKKHRKSKSKKYRK